MEPHELLTKARFLLLRGWCRYALARTAFGVPCHPNDPRATAWSLHGAVLRASEDLLLDHSFPFVRDRLKDYVWANHRLYLMWCDDSPDFGARDAIAAVDALLNDL